MKLYVSHTIGATMLLIRFCSGASPGAAQDDAHHDAKTIPVRGVHLSAPAKKDLALTLEFIHESLPKEGVNTLILEFDFSFDFRSRPEFALDELAKACETKSF